MEPPKQAPKKKPNSLENPSPEDLEKVERARASTEGHAKVDTEWLLLAEFGLKYGWQAYLDAKNDARDEEGNLIVTMAEMLTLLEASRRIDNFYHYRNAQASFIGAASSRAKKPSSTFKQVTSKIIKNAKADT